PSLTAFARERGLRPAVLQEFGVRAVVHQNRNALRYPTSVGVDRIKFVDGRKPKYIWAAKGGKAHWYNLEGAMAVLQDGGGARLYLVNGEPSVWACVAENVPAVCVASGEGPPPTAAMVAELRDRLASLHRPVEIAVAYDADRAGTAGGPKVAAALRAAFE